MGKARYTVALTQQECLMAEAGARRIMNVTDKTGSRDFTVGSRFRTHRMGMGGEIAMHRLLGLSLEGWTPGESERRNMGDCYAIEIRSTTYSPPWLRLNDRDRPKLGRAFACMHASKDMVSYEFVGWLRGTVAMELAGEGRDFGNGELTYVVPDGRLRDPYELLERFAIWAEGRGI